MSYDRSSAVGKTFHWLTVIEELPGGKGKNRRVKCRCKCGKITENAKYRIISGKIYSCGCQRRHQHKDLVGRHFGKLVVLEILYDYAEKGGKCHSRAKCLCDCGNETLPLLYNIIRGNTISCGCWREQCPKATGKNHSHFSGYEDISGTFWSQCIISAKKRNMDFEIDLPYIWELFESQDRCCALTGVSLVLKTRNSTASIDRIDSSLGYIKGNVQWVHKCVNLMRGPYSIQCFKEVCLLVAKQNDWIPNPNGDPLILMERPTMMAASSFKKEKALQKAIAKKPKI